MKEDISIMKEVPYSLLQKQINLASSTLESSSLVAEMSQIYQEACIHHNFQSMVLWIGFT